MAKPDAQALWDHRVLRVQKAQKAKKGQRETLGPREAPAPREIRDPQEQTAVSRVPPAKKAMTVMMVTMETLVQQDPRVSRETVERRECEAHKEAKGARARRDQSVLQGLSALLGQ